MKKVLLCTPYALSNTGGIVSWAHHIMDYYSSLPEKNIDLKLCPMDRTIYLDETASQIKRMYLGLKDYKQIVRNIKTVVSGNNFDIVHIASSASISLIKDIYLLKFLRQNNIKSVIHFRFGRIPQIFNKRNWECHLLKQVLSLADKVIVIDKASHETLKNQGYKNIALIPNPLSPRIVEMVENNKNITREKGKIFFAGHLYKTKGVYELVEACTDIPNITLKMAGQYVENVKQELISIAQRKGNCEWIEFTGNLPIENIVHEMQTCDIFTLPTYTEGFPNVIIESMACGCAIVTTPVGAIPEMLEEKNGKKYGIMVEPKNTAQLKSAIEQMLNDESLKNECRKNVADRVTRRYNLPVIWEQMQNIWMGI